MSFSTGGEGTAGPWVQYAGDGSADEFSLPHKIYDEDQVVALLTVDATLVTTVQTITSEYTVAGVADDAHDSTTPTITMLTKPAIGETFTLYRVGALVQNLTLLQTAAWHALPVEKQLDLIVMDLQWLYITVYKRAALGSLASPAVTTTLEELLLAAGIIPLSGLTAKTAAVDADLALIGDSDVSFASKKITFANLLVYILSKFVNTSAGAGDAGKGIKLNGVGLIDSNMITDGSDSTAVHINVAAEIAGLAAIVLADGDALIIEDLDSGPANSKKKVLASAIWTYILAKIAAAGLTLGGTLDMNSQDIDNAKAITFIAEVANSGASPQAIDWGAGQKQKFTLSEATTLTFTAPDGPGNFVLKVVQAAAVGSYDITWPATVKWSGGTAPVITAAVNSIDIITFYYDGTNYYAAATQDFS